MLCVVVCEIFCSLLQWHTDCKVTNWWWLCGLLCLIIYRSALQVVCLDCLRPATYIIRLFAGALYRSYDNQHQHSDQTATAAFPSGFWWRSSVYCIWLHHCIFLLCCPELKHTASGLHSVLQKWTFELVYCFCLCKGSSDWNIINMIINVFASNN